LNKIFLLLTITFSLPLMGIGRALPGLSRAQITPMSNSMDNSSAQPYCTYERMYNSSIGKCIKTSGSATENCLHSGLIFCGDRLCICSSTCALSLLTAFTYPVGCPLACLKDTCCLPCDRNATPPQCYPYTKLLCYFLTCEKFGNLPN
jgi:hypothetical protein